MDHFSSDFLSLGFVIESSRIELIGVEIRLVTKSLVCGHVELRVGKLSAVDFADMHGIAIHVHLFGSLLVPAIVGVDAGQPVGDLPVIAHVIEPARLGEHVEKE